MAFREDLVNLGNWLFRWRSYLPLLLILLILSGMPYFEYPGESYEWAQMWQLFCLFFSCVGVAIRGFTIGFTPKGTSGTNTRGQVAEKLNTTGMYSVVRHPLYLGNFIMTVGMSLILYLWWFTVIVALIFWLYYERIMFAEEEFLRSKFGDTFLNWAEKTPAFIPKFRNWQPPEGKFSYRKCLKNEYKSFFGMIASFFVIQTIVDSFVEHSLQIDKMWSILLISSAIFYIVVRSIKKRTSLLDD